MKKLIIVADDFGFSPGVTKGIIEGKLNGIITELSMMMWSPGTKEAVEKIMELSIKEVGIHLTLNNLNATGKYMHTTDYEKFLNETSIEEITKLAVSELNDFENLVGKKPTHITAHQNIHKHPKLIETIANYAGQNNIPVRKANRLGSGTGIESKGEAKNITEIFRKYNVRTTDYIFSHIVGSYEEVKTAFIHDLKNIEDSKSVELLFHPGYIDEIQTKYTSLLKERGRDLKLILDLDFKNHIKDLGFKLVNYSDV